MSSLMDNTIAKGARLMSQANKKLESFAPPSELNRSNYKRIIAGKSDEAEFELLRQKYGDAKVYLWIKENQDANR